MTHDDNIITAIADVLSRETAIASPRIHKTCTDITAAHNGHVLGFLYYGSSLRDVDDVSKMLDFYVIVDSYKTVHKGRPIRQLINRLIPPVVYYYERLDEDNALTSCKYSLISLPEFERRASAKALLSVIWGRFAQPSLLYAAQNDAVTQRILTARAHAVLHLARSTEGLFDAPIDAVSFWTCGFRESYRTELRPESSGGRAREIVAQYAARYEELMQIIYGAPNAAGHYILPQLPASRTRRKWRLRRIIGKPTAALRVLCNAMTFDGGLDYVLRKIDRHSGVSIEPTPFQRKHPVFCSPILAWKLWRRGAFR
jgi:hypothetical protein